MSEIDSDDNGGAQAGQCPPETCNHTLTYQASVCLGCSAVIYGNAYSTDNPPPEAVREVWSIPTDDLLKITAFLDEHPKDWTWPCMCMECRSYIYG